MERDLDRRHARSEAVSPLGDEAGASTASGRKQADTAGSRTCRGSGLPCRVHIQPPEIYLFASIEVDGKAVANEPSRKHVSDPDGPQTAGQCDSLQTQRAHGIHFGCTSGWSPSSNHRQNAQEKWNAHECQRISGAGLEKNCRPGSV